MYIGEAKVDIMYEYTFQKTITYPLLKVAGKMIFSFHRWDMWSI